MSSVLHVSRYWCGKIACHEAQWHQLTVENAVREMCPEMKRALLCVVDCRCLHDANQYFDRGHLGIHYKNIKGILMHWMLDSVLTPMAQAIAHAMRTGSNDPVNIVCVCRSGHHRSVAVARLMYQVVKNDARLRLGRLLDMTDGHWSHGCGNCVECTWSRQSVARKEALEHGLKVWHGLFEKAVRGKL